MFGGLSLKLVAHRHIPGVECLPIRMHSSGLVSWVVVDREEKVTA